MEVGNALGWAMAELLGGPLVSGRPSERNERMMRTSMKICGLAILVSLYPPTQAWPRKVESWPYDRLMTEADLVVIAHAVSSAACQDKWRESLFQNVKFQGVETTFKVSALLKGKSPATLKMLHFRLKNRVLPNDGPGLVTFLRKPVLLQVRHDEQGLQQFRQSLVSPPEYLLYLRRRQDGRYEAVSGQVDPKFSVRALFHQSGL